MASQMSKEEEFKLARKMQDLFRDSIKSIMDGNVAEFDSTAQRFLKSHEDCSVEDMIVDFQSEGKTLIHIAASSGKYEMLEHLMTSCSSENLKQLLDKVSAPGASLTSAHGNAENIAKLRKLVNMQDHRGFTPLINATISENEDSMRLLLRLGADVNARNDDGASAAHFAASDGSVPRLQLLAEYNARFELQSRSGSALHWAAGKGRDTAIVFLLDHEHARASSEGKVAASEVQSWIDASNSEGLTAVFMAAAASCDLGAAALIRAGASLLLANNNNTKGPVLTALHISAEHGLTHAVQAALETERGRACVELVTHDGLTPLQLSLMSAHKEVSALLWTHTSTEHRRSLLSPAPPRHAEEGHAQDIDVEKEVLKEVPSEEAMRALLRRGHALLQEWHDARANDQSQSLSTSSNQSSESESSARFDAVQCSGERTADILSRAEQCKSRANKLYSEGHFEQAISAYSEAIGLDKNNAVYWSNRSACYLTMKQNHEALLDAEVCRRLNPDWAKGCYRLASARLACGQYEDAALAAFEGCKLDSHNEELKALLQKSVKLGQEEHQRNLAAAQSKHT